MSSVLDRRLRPANTRVALAGFEAEGQAVVMPERLQVGVPVADLCAAPQGRLDRQLIWGEAFNVLEQRDGWAFGVAARDGYVGYMRSDHLTPFAPVSHTVSARATFAFPEQDFKAPPVHTLSFGSRLKVVDERKAYFETADGFFVPKPHVRPIERLFSDPVTIAQLFFGAPYLWGGNSSFGIDCSGLVQAALLACGIDCPGDSDQQQSIGVAAEGGYARGDLLFWPGHVAICVDEQVLLHATSTFMSVSYEPIEKALKRIDAQGDGPFLAHRRVNV